MAVYETGFSGYSTYYALSQLGIHCIIVHAADVPTTQNEKIKKSDKVDSVKFAKGLKSGVLRGFYIHEKGNWDARALVRLRCTYVRDHSSYKSRVKHKLYENGIEYPEMFLNSQSHWSARFLKWLHKEVQLLSSSGDSPDFLDWI